MYSGGSIFVGPSPVRRSLRVAQMTPSKINLPYDDISEADSEATVKPLKLLGQRGGSRSRSRSPAKTRTPGRKSGGPGSAAKGNPFINPMGSRVPLRLDTPGPELGSLLDSRVKHARNLDNYDEGTPFKGGFGDWPSESLVTPLATVQNNRRISPPRLDDNDGTIRAPKIKTLNPNGSIFLGRPVAQKKAQNLSQLYGKIDVRQLLSLSVLILAFTITLFYRGEIISYAQDGLSALQSMTIRSSPLEQTWRRDLENVFGDLQVLKRDLSRMPQIDLSGILDRLDQVEGREASNDSLLQNIRQRLIEVQKSVAALNEDGQMSGQRVIEVTQKLSSMDQRLGALEGTTGKLDKTVNDHAQSLLLISERLKDISSSEDILKMTMEKVEAMLPEKLLVRLSSKGEILLDPKLFSYLQSVFSSGEGGGGGGTVDLGPLEKSVQSKLDSIEHRLLGKPQVAALVKEHLEKSLAGLQKELEGDLKKLRSYVDSSTRSGKPSIDSDKIADDLFRRVAAKLEKEHSKPQAEPVDTIDSPNFCSEAAGARPIIALSSKSYHNGDQGNTWKHWVTWATCSAKPHRVALSSDNSFGNCWAFPGSTGHLTVQLAVEVAPTAFQICHLGKEYRADRSSAPAAFEIYAIPSIAVPDETVLLGKYKYDLNGHSCQSFKPQIAPKNPSKHFQIRIMSNHGKLDYTCLYQFGIYSDSHSV